MGSGLWLFVGCGVLGMAICVTPAPETKGERLEDLDRRLIGDAELGAPRAEAAAAGTTG